MRIVADTNIVLSAFLWGGTPREILRAAQAQQVGLWTSPALVAELQEILSRPKFARRFAALGSTPAILLDRYLALAQLVQAPALPAPVSRDPDDDQVIACAIAAQADLIVSGDDDLLSLRQHRGIAIVSAVQAVERIRSGAQ